MSTSEYDPALEMWDEERWKDALLTYKKIIKLGTAEKKYARERIDWIRKNVKQ